ncbi:MAG: alpha/beta fold hydrolase [Thermoanaerobaculia bacterium]
MSRGTGRYLKSDRGSRVAKRLLLAGAAVGVPLLAGALLRRRAEPPSAPRWGRAHRYAGRSGREVVFQELGAGPPVVLLHSFGPGYGGDQWRTVAESLAEHYCVYVPDLPGWGRTRAAGNAHRPDAYLSLIEDFLAGVVRDRAVIVASGLAAAYAVRVAVDHPHRVRALALVSPEGLGEDGIGRFRSAAGAVVGRLLSLPLLDALVLDLLTGRAALDHHLRREVYAAPERVDAALLEHHYRSSHAPQSRAALSAYLRGDLWLDVTEELAQVHVPVWLAWGRGAKQPPVEQADLWLRNLPDADLDVFEGAGALPHAETPALFSRGLERFLGRVG